jgi:hypothetical protein
VAEPEKRDRLAMSGSVTLTMAVAVIGILALTIAFGFLLSGLGGGAGGLFPTVTTP